MLLKYTKKELKYQYKQLQEEHAPMEKVLQLSFAVDRESNYHLSTTVAKKGPHEDGNKGINVFLTCTHDIFGIMCFLTKLYWYVSAHCNKMTYARFDCLARSVDRHKGPS